eukprot:TRINITY_DN2943_c0_g1_i14.p2 TRINITY_DN2943_c0_g1~~TRINITY_DN2943_c0_g1_i14.p2  ORF type:complete len:202 (-),score=16.02 TRINITY_DN2943_c0_g1_i14:84-689(-)
MYLPYMHHHVRVATQRNDSPLQSSEGNKHGRVAQCNEHAGNFPTISSFDANSGYSPAQFGRVGMPLNPINGSNVFGNGIFTPSALAMLAGQVRAPQSQQTHEMTIPNELIGCIIGKGGSKVAEIRQLSGAMIRISNSEDRDAPANLDRIITITGNSESVALAQYLISMRISMETASMGGLAGFQYIFSKSYREDELTIEDK